MRYGHKDFWEELIDIGAEAGRAILDIYHDGIVVTYKEDRSPLTMADQRSHAVITTRLKKVTPDIPVISEEGADIPYEERSEWGSFWLVDPLDGTKEFIKRNGEFTVNIALIERDRPVMGVVYVPVKDVLYYAEKGKGAFKVEGGETTRLKVREKVDKGYIVAESRSHRTPEIEEFLKRIPVQERISAGSSLKFCLVAEGKADLYPRFGPTMEWDTAAGQCLVEEAGGKVIGRDGGPLSYNRRELRHNGFIAMPYACALAAEDFFATEHTEHTEKKP